MTAKPAAYDKEVLYAFRALFDGKANDGQQKRAMEWLLLNACHIGQLSYSANERDSAFSEGERHIGLQVARMREPEALKLIEGRSRAEKMAAATKPEAGRKAGE
ncbi:hypothetical protein HGP16_25495 [Rhizobium sp. P40RR-XXII]|uniref:Bbp19 family protein n=1 Tax=Rhizobium sp. P40RR-XXII TaxID=2726739 RepID=UPI001456B955|nr:hypothetical protein [Rhizobium sp. P40RR-XXII]NLS19897.1 hypothetical protein [Rhizobium sp. P40RR-XXII]